VPDLQEAQSEDERRHVRAAGTVGGRGEEHDERFAEQERNDGARGREQDERRDARENGTARVIDRRPRIARLRPLKHDRADEL
jgi:hypothetical protein